MEKGADFHGRGGGDKDATKNMSLQEENQKLIHELETRGIHFRVNPRKTDIQKNISLWQAHAANGLCAPGTYGVHARKKLDMDSPEEAEENNLPNPFEEDMSAVTDKLYKTWPNVKKTTMQALNWGNVDTWKDALKKCREFRSQLKPKLDKGDKEAQEFNRTHVITLGQVV